MSSVAENAEPARIAAGGIVEFDTQRILECATPTDVVVLPARLFGDLHRAATGHEVAHAVLTHMSGIVPGDRHSMALAHDAHTVEVVHLEGDGVTLASGVLFPRDRTIVGRAFRSGRTALGVDYANRYEIDAVMLRSKDLNSGICHPVVHRDRVVATLNVASRSAEQYTRQDVLRLRALAELAGFHLAMRNRIDEAERLASVDPLTQAANRRAFVDWLEARLHGDPARPFALGILDLDHFKSINDTFGHTAGDAVLVAVADCMRAQVRPGDLVARFGGEEFAVLIDGVDEDEATEVFERTIAEIQALRFGAAVEGRAVTASIGGTVRRHGDRSVSDLFERADRALYQAKDAGRNRLVMTPGS